MTDFYKIVSESSDMPGFTENPYAGQTEDGTWIVGLTSIDFLNLNFGSFSTTTEMKASTTSEGLQLYFDWLVQQGKLTA
jgi:hypothetical protein